MLDILKRSRHERYVARQNLADLPARLPKYNTPVSNNDRSEQLFFKQVEKRYAHHGDDKEE